MFKKLIAESKGNYAKYIIMPSNLEGTAAYIKTLPPNDTYILDQTNEDLKDYPSVHQDFEADMYNALMSGIVPLKKYAELIFVFPGKKEPYGMVLGFEKFCRESKVAFSIVSTFESDTIKTNTLFIVINDDHLVKVIEQAKRQQLALGTDYGIISYNDTSLKKVVENGITTISTDFVAMGKILAEMINSTSKKQVKNKSQLIIRNSL